MSIDPSEIVPGHVTVSANGGPKPVDARTPWDQLVRDYSGGVSGRTA